jgi:hypothetical protein
MHLYELWYMYSSPMCYRCSHVPHATLQVVSCLRMLYQAGVFRPLGKPQCNLIAPGAIPATISLHAVE